MVKIIPNIPILFNGQFPKGYSNKLELEGFHADKLKETLIDGTPKLLMMDIEFGTECSLNCPHCFRKSKMLNSPAKKEIPYGGLLGIMDEAKDLGLECVRIVGAGEPFEDPRFIGFLRDLKEKGIRAGIFTKGHVIGDDEFVREKYSSKGICSGKQLVDELKRLDTNIILEFGSFYSEMQDKRVGPGKIKDYSQKRNKALELLVDAGFNKTNPTKLALYSAPITPENIGEIFEIYTWGRKRNLFVISTPTMVSGLGRLQKERQEKSYGKERFEEELIKLYTKINTWNVENGVISLEELNKQGISCYAGCFPCNQASCGMYMTSKGKVLRCLGRDDEQSTFCDDIRGHSLKEVWLSSENCKRAGTFNNHCPAKDGRTIPTRLYTEVLKQVNAYFSKK